MHKIKYISKVVLEISCFFTSTCKIWLWICDTHIFCIENYKNSIILKKLIYRNEFFLIQVIYIAAAAGGIILVSIITICLVCHKKRYFTIILQLYNVSNDICYEIQFTCLLNINLNPLSLNRNNSLKRLPGEINMKYSVNHQGYNCGFNEFYKSADDVTECQNGDVTQSSLESYSAAPYYNLKMTYSKLEPEEDLYSYASKF